MKKILWLLFLSLSLFFTNNAADAAEILQSQGGVFSGTTIQDNKVRINLSGNVKYIRHTKYEQSSWSNPVAYKQLRANSSFTGFAYTCPGYYMTRVYSDSAGTQLIGWVRVYVDNSDISDPSCTALYDTSKSVPPSTQRINVTHPSDVVEEPSKMITQSTSVSPSNPVIRDMVDEDLAQFVAGQVDAATLSAEQACNLKASTTGVAYQYKYNSNKNSFECVVTSDCMYNSSLWYCNAPTVAQKYANSSSKIDNPNRAAYLEDSCEGETCNYMYTLNNYSRSTNNVIHNGLIATTPDIDYGDSYVPLIDNTDEPYVQPVVNDPWLTPKTDGELCYNPDGTPNYSATSCWCDDPDMQAAYSFCQSSTGGDNVGMVEQRPDADYCYYFGATDPSCPSDSYPDPTNQEPEPEQPSETTHTQLCFPDRDPDCYSGTTEPEMTEGTTHTQLWFPDQDVKPTDPEPDNNGVDDSSSTSSTCPGGCCPGDMCLLWDCPGLDQKINEFKDFLLDDLVGTAEAPIVPDFEAPEAPSMPNIFDVLNDVDNRKPGQEVDPGTAEAPSVPDFEAPSMPNIFDVLNDVDSRKPEPITTEEDPVLKDATFNADDIKAEAEELPFRDDPTEGFNIENPLETLPEDGSSAPRQKLDSLQYPGASGNTKHDEGQKTPTPSNGGQNDNQAMYPSYSDKANTPDYSSSAETPNYSDSVKIPINHK